MSCREKNKNVLTKAFTPHRSFPKDSPPSHSEMIHGKNKYVEIRPLSLYSSMPASEFGTLSKFLSLFELQLSNSSEKWV